MNIRPWKRSVFPCRLSAYEEYMIIPDPVEPADQMYGRFYVLSEHVVCALQTGAEIWATSEQDVRGFIREGVLVEVTVPLGEFRYFTDRDAAPNINDYAVVGEDVVCKMCGVHDFNIALSGQCGHFCIAHLKEHMKHCLRCRTVWKNIIV